MKRPIRDWIEDILGALALAVLLVVLLYAPLFIGG